MAVLWQSDLDKFMAVIPWSYMSHMKWKCGSTFAYDSFSVRDAKYAKYTVALVHVFHACLFEKVKIKTRLWEMMYCASCS